MEYREDKISGNKLSALGLGCMRFPPVGGEAEKIVVSAIENGVNFFDTAYIYPGSEKTLGGILAKHGLRERVFIATKLPISMCKSRADFDRILDEQLVRLKTDYIDYYFIHNISNFVQWQMMLDLGIEAWLAEKKAEGKIRRVGFSYHGSGEEFPRVLDSYAWEFCMIQYNYYDENYQAGKRGLKLAAERGLPVIIMEPLLGGKLATGLPKKCVELFSRADETKTPAEWALGWLWNQPEVTVVLSGTSKLKFMEENLASLKRFKPLSEADLAVFSEVVEHFKKSFKVKCTGCNYCLPCPKGIDIPARLSAYNASYAQGYFSGIVMYMTGMGLLTQNPIFARSCNSCKKCEKACPQQIEIAREMKRVARRFEHLLFRVLMKILRAVMR